MARCAASRWLGLGRSGRPGSLPRPHLSVQPWFRSVGAGWPRTNEPLYKGWLMLGRWNKPVKPSCRSWMLRRPDALRGGRFADGHKSIGEVHFPAEWIDGNSADRSGCFAGGSTRLASDWCREVDRPCRHSCESPARAERSGATLGTRLPQTGGRCATGWQTPFGRHALA